MKHTLLMVIDGMCFCT